MIDNFAKEHPFLNADMLNVFEAESIRSALALWSEHIRGVVLDFGCGTPDTCRKPSPYKDLVEHLGGRYVGYDPAAGHDPAKFLQGPYDTIICTQVLQYIEAPFFALDRMRHAIRAGGHLLITVPSTWREIEPGDLWRFTQSGLRFLLKQTGWETVAITHRGQIEIPGFPIYLGHAALARCPE